MSDSDGFREAIPQNAPAHLRLTYDDYCRIPSEQRYELIGGGLRMVPSPSVFHQTVCGNLMAAFWRWAEERGLGVFYFSPIDVVLSDHDVVQPDILFVAKERRGIIREKNIKGAPDLVVEVISPSAGNRDRFGKRGLYARYGVRELWLVDLKDQSVEVAVFRDGELVTHEVHRYDSRLVSPVLAGFSLDLSILFGQPDLGAGYPRDGAGAATDSDRSRDTAPEYVRADQGSIHKEHPRIPPWPRYEFGEGERRMLRSPSVFHQKVAGRVEKALRLWVEERGMGEVYDSPIDVFLSEDDVLQPDVIYVSKERLGIIGNESIEGAPDLVVEVLSQATEDWDRITKRRIYARFGVRELWFVYPEGRSVETAVLFGGELVTHQVCPCGTSMTGLLLPGFSLDVGGLFRR